MTDEQFNPSEHTVDEVNEYLGTVTDDAERSRVLGAEDKANGGKGRVGILEGTHDAPTPDPNADTAPQPEGTGKPEDDRDLTKAQTFAEAGGTVPEMHGEPYEKGYEGYVPSRDGDKPVDLTLQGVLGDDHKDA